MGQTQMTNKINVVILFSHHGIEVTANKQLFLRTYVITYPLIDDLFKRCENSSAQIANAYFVPLLRSFLISIQNLFVFNNQSLTNLNNRMILCYLDDVYKSFINEFTRITKNQYPFPVYETPYYRRFSLQWV